MPTPLAETGILPWVDLPYPEELALKHSRVATALARARLSVEVAPVVASPRRTGARARVSLHRGPGRQLGLHHPGTHDFVPVHPEDPEGPLAVLARPELVAVATRLGGRADLPDLLELRTDGDKTVLVAEVKLPAEAWGEAHAAGRDREHGDPRLFVHQLRVSPRSFFQVNLEINARIVTDVTARLATLRPERLLDLYAGIGNLSAPTVRAGVAAVLVEEDRSACADARYNVDPRAGAKGVAEVVRQDLRRYQPGTWPFDVALLDPPRAGAPGLLPKLAVTRPRAVLYLSCDPVTLARDVATIVPLGYEVRHVQPYDMFPGADHVETLLVLERR